MDTPLATLYTREGCHLCEEAHATLVRYGVQVESVDVDADPTLLERHGHRVPLVLIDGKERFRFRVNPRLLRRLLAGRSSPGRRTDAPSD